MLTKQVAGPCTFAGDSRHVSAPLYGPAGTEGSIVMALVRGRFRSHSAFHALVPLLPPLCPATTEPVGPIDPPLAGSATYEAYRGHRRSVLRHSVARPVTMTRSQSSIPLRDRLEQEHRPLLPSSTTPQGTTVNRTSPSPSKNARYFPSRRAQGKAVGDARAEDRAP